MVISHAMADVIVWVRDSTVERDDTMPKPAQIFTVLQPLQRRFHWGDLVVLLGVAVFIYTGVSLAVHTPLALRGPDISLAPEVLPYYVSLSVGRMAGASAIPKDLQYTADLLQLGR